MKAKRTTTPSAGTIVTLIWSCVPTKSIQARIFWPNLEGFPGSGVVECGGLGGYRDDAIEVDADVVVVGVVELLVPSYVEFDGEERGAGVGMEEGKEEVGGGAGEGGGVGEDEGESEARLGRDLREDGEYDVGVVVLPHGESGVGVLFRWKSCWNRSLRSSEELVVEN